jgi:hypothetical protein
MQVVVAGGYPSQPRPDESTREGIANRALRVLRRSPVARERCTDFLHQKRGRHANRSNSPSADICAGTLGASLHPEENGSRA